MEAITTFDIIDYQIFPGIHNTLLHLLPENLAKTSPCWPLTTSMKPGIGCLSVFIGLRGTTEELGLKAQNVWAFNGSSSEDVILKNLLFKPPKYLNFYFKRDSNKFSMVKLWRTYFTNPTRLFLLDSHRPKILHGKAAIQVRNI